MTPLPLPVRDGRLCLLLLTAVLACGDKDGADTSDPGSGATGSDADGDGWTSDSDCDDSDADISPSAAELCAGGVDEDCDGALDCDDPGCEGDAACLPSTETDCDNSVDDDGDGLTDCGDDDCVGESACLEDCGNGVDDDLDGLTDCADDDCVGESACLEDCGNGVDDDGDGFTDCADGDCAGASTCVEDCSNGVDDDLDGLTDCEDGDCAAESTCFEDCGNGVDDEGDGLTDCDDDECWAEPGCAPTVLASWATGGSMTVKYLLDIRHYERDGTHTYEGTFSNTYFNVRATGVTGLTRQQLPSGTTTTCGWTVDTMVLVQTAVDGNSYSPGDWDDSGASPVRYGVAVDGPCMATDYMLPFELMHVRRRGSDPTVFWGLRDGMYHYDYAWYQGVVLGSSHTFVSSWYSPGGYTTPHGTHWAYTGGYEVEMSSGRSFVDD